ncbi:MAG: hypothetical protein A2498_04500 [Lentisphaerae bacterium RIFOXYC12_FULL_60_16]|nr:MAG: hypothetical protein A2498_04500 [Lentisphaerae bacterium RIFOXYC12_FULL_60_16]
MEVNNTTEQSQNTTNPQQIPATPPPEHDTFMQATRKALGALERFVGWLYQSARKALGNVHIEPYAVIRRIDRLLVWARTTFPPDKFDSVSAWAARSGHGGLIVAQILALIFFLVVAIKLENWVFILHGAGIAALLVILQYSAERFMNAGKSLIQASPSRMNSGAFLDCLALIVEVGGILMFIAFIMQARRLSSWSPFWTGLGVWALCDCVAYIALNPSMANTTVSSGGSAGDEAIGILSFFVKAIVCIVPLAFGIGAVIGSVALFIAIFSVIGDINRIAAGQQALWLIGLCACLPFGTYLLFVLYHLAIDVIQAILAIPQKLEKR